MTLIKEDGTGRPDANSYADAGDGDAYHDGHLYATAWTGASAGDKEKALVMATRLIDSLCQFIGERAHDEQALQWPRTGDISRWFPGSGLPLPVVAGELWSADGWLPTDAVPKGIMNAACEMARELLLRDRTAPVPGEGIAVVTTGAGLTYSSTKYSKTDAPQIITPVAKAMLQKYGSVMGGRGGMVKVMRS